MRISDDANLQSSSSSEPLQAIPIPGAGPHVADRVVALDMLSLLGAAAAGLAAAATGSMAFVDVALGVALVGFLATVAFAGFIERGSRHRKEGS